MAWEKDFKSQFIVQTLLPHDDYVTSTSMPLLCMSDVYDGNEH